MKKITSLLLSLMLIVSMIGILPVKVEAASETEMILYETSLWNVTGKNATPKTSTFTLVEGQTGYSNIQAIKTVSKSVNFVDITGEWTYTFTENGGNYTLESIGHIGGTGDIDLVLPDKFTLYHVEQITTASSEKQKTCNVTTFSGYLTGIKTAFNNDCVGKFSNTKINLTIPVAVTELESKAFYNNTKLNSVKFLGSIQSIGSEAFSGCNRLTELNLADALINVTNNTIPKGCFKNCSELKDIVIPDTIIRIESEAFYGCNRLDTITLNDRIEEVGKNAFAACSGLRYIYIESTAQDWSEIVSSNEKNKLITSKVTSKPVVAVKGTNNDLGGKYIYGANDVAIFSKVDMKQGSILVTKDGQEVSDVKVYTDQTYGYRTNAYYFSISTSMKGEYTVTGEDVLGNRCSTSFSYLTDSDDKTPPNITINGVGSDNCYQEATIIFNDAETFVTSSTLNGKAINSGYVEKTEGTYELIVKDALGNTAKKTFIVDKTAPTISGIKNGDELDKGVTISFSDNLAGIKSVTLNNKVMATDSFSLYESGKYTLIVTDKALNKTTYTFTLDTVKPTLEGIVDNKFYNTDVVCKFVSVSGIISADVTYKAADKSSSTYQISDGQVLSKDGEYSIKLTDKLGKTNTIKFKIDQTAPKVTGISNNKHYKKKQVAIKVADDNLESAMLNGKSIGKGKTIKDEGKYTLICKDKAGNVTTIKFTIDRTKPKCTVKKNKTYKKGVKVWATDKVSGIKKVTLDGKKIKKKTKVKKAGTHTLVATDNAGNKVTVKFKVK